MPEGAGERKEECTPVLQLRRPQRHAAKERRQQRSTTMPLSERTAASAEKAARSIVVFLNQKDE
jgi:hypothetical protein